MAGGLEVELKYRAETEAPLEALGRRDALGPATLAAARAVGESDRYLDTAGGRLAAARWACRLRAREGRTLVSLKGPAQHPATGALHRRPELEGPAAEGADPAAWPFSAARDLLLRLSGGEPLVERLTLLQERTERRLAVAGAAAGTLTLDRVRVLHRGAQVGQLRVVELELSEAGEAVAAELDAVLSAIPGLRPDPATKLEHALAMIEGAARSPEPAA
jgi:inorganic triphosphatase YgiF